MSILNELDEKRFQLWREGEALGGRVRKSDKTLTDEELNTFLEQSLSARIKEAELEKTITYAVVRSSRYRRLFVCPMFAGLLLVVFLSNISTSVGSLCSTRCRGESTES